VLGSDTAAHLQPVYSRKHQVEHHKIRRIRGDDVESFVPVCDVHRLMAGAIEVADYHTGHRPVVVDDKYACHIESLGSRNSSHRSLPHFVRR